LEQLQLTRPVSAHKPAAETLVVRVRGHELRLQGDWSKVFKPTGSSLALARGLKVKRGDVVFEAGVGCGVNSILAAKLGAAQVFGSDVVPHAVATARKNAQANGVHERTDFRPGSLFEPFNGDRFHVALADLPFAPDMPPATQRELGLSRELVSALCGGPAGFEATVSFVREAGKRLKPGGRIYFTIGELTNVPRAVADLSKEFEVEEVHGTYSYLSIDRPAFARYLMTRGARLDFTQRRPRFRVAVYEAKPKRR
jgi:release factor glutamine methyltransferase